jgi:hypothetical protein
MDMEVWDGLSAIGAIVDHNAVAVFTEAFLTSRCGGG